MKTKKLIATLALIGGTFLSHAAAAKDHVIEMLDQGDGGTMLFKPDFLKVAPGDTVTFKPVHKTHYVKAMAVPAGAQKFASTEDAELTVKLDQPGVYFYVCPPHMMMAMIGAIQVGEGEALQPQAAQAAKTASALRGRMMMNKERADILIKKIETAK